MPEQEPARQHRVTLEEDISEVVRQRNNKKGKSADTRFVNDCLREFFISKGWMKESREPEDGGKSS